MVDYELDGKVAIVTGAAGGGAGGTGLRIAQLLAEQGAKVVMADIKPTGQEESDKLNEQGLDTFFVQMDLADEASIVALVDAAVERYGTLDIVVNCGFMQLKEGQLHETPAEVWDRIIAVDMRGDFLMIHHSLPHLLKQGGAIVNVSSTASLSGEDNTAAYACAKAGVNALTRSVAVQYGDRGVRCNTVVPGSILSEGILAYAETNESVKFQFDMLKRHAPLKRHGTADDIANAVLFLASPIARNITGQTLVSDGGYSIRSGMWADIHEYKQTHSWDTM
ncbi:SDR family NAD(P)-dependent oxidoreductase [Gordonibacter massiliensis (ex Traore et al. 2017)]|uniref:3beta-hydroxycholanate 3-dehydrogenase (NAD(+)) n=1 Tax=Gordonibacter massiliensis (ex Traore et al. 2017) TaxID=1841863 RepID=A0A842JEC3_9ACTN|nr:SDR family oxidoreductase [Gordonibacter massiliensis (ex Traore et al. 2017)]MBC2889276.1 SDR family oxidoreductase [Gordonibacter massiliensis (ex Traore et al. 2017)]